MALAYLVLVYVVCYYVFYSRADSGVRRINNTPVLIVDTYTTFSCDIFIVFFASVVMFLFVLLWA